MPQLWKIAKLSAALQNQFQEAPGHLVYQQQYQHFNPSFFLLQPAMYDFKRRREELLNPIVEYCLDHHLSLTIPMVAAFYVDQYFDKCGLEKVQAMDRNLNLTDMTSLALLSLNAVVNQMSSHTPFDKQDFVERVLTSHAEIDNFNCVPQW